MARLGLRGGEVVGLDLADFDWGAGTVRVRGKGGREDILPLPADAGEAVARYLAPWPSSMLVSESLRPREGATAWLRKHGSGLYDREAGTGTRRTGPTTQGRAHSPPRACLLHAASRSDPHRNRGRSCDTVHADTTTIYAKVDIEALRSLAPAWPGGGR